MRGETTRPTTDPGPRAVPGSWAVGWRRGVTAWIEWAGRFAVGDLGPGARDAIDWMASAGFRVWQVLPLGPPAFAAAPYTCLSSFAANPLLISPEALVEDGLLEEDILCMLLVI